MEYPYEIREKKIGNLNLKIVGVRHTPKFFNKHVKYLERELAGADHLFFEDGLPNNKFYKNLADLGQGKHKSIYVPDSTEWNFASDALVSFAGAGIAIKSLSNMGSRREFVKNGLKLFGGVYFASGFIGLNEEFFRNFTESESTTDNVLSYSSVRDFRNIVSAENLCRAEKDLGMEGNATYFIGGAHLDGLNAYLENPELRKKRVLYFPQDLLSDNKIKEYKKIEGDWKVANKI